MAVTPSSVVNQMRQALAISDPDLDTTVGTSGRKILDAVGEVVAEAYVDRYLLDYAYDIDSKVGSDLDDFVQLFGFNRIPARRGAGMVTFERQTPSDQNTIISHTTQLATGDAVPVIVATAVPAVLLKGDTSITVPAQAVLPGASGNISANALTRALTPIDGVGSFTNTVAFTGGADAESDAQLRARFKKTVFRNLAGTESMFLAVALDNDFVTQANVIGAARRRREQIHIQTGTSTSGVVNAKYVYPRSSVLGADLDNGQVLIEGVHYTISSATPPVVSSIGTAVPDGIYDLEFDYVPGASRNDPVGGVTNRVDLYVNGRRDQEAEETAVFRTARVFNINADDPLNINNFERAQTGAKPVAGNYFVALAFAPVVDVSVSNQITIGGVVYVEGTDYFTVNDISREGGSFKSLAGIEFVSTANGATKAIPANDTTFSATYVFNAVPRDVEESVRAWRLVTTDARVHQAKQIRLDMHFAVILAPGFTAGGVRPELYSALNAHINGVGFAGILQVSDLLDVAHSVPGVDAIRMTTSADGQADYAIQQVNNDGSVKTLFASDGTGGQTRRAVDIYLADDEVAALNQVTLLLKAQNSFGVN